MAEAHGDDKSRPSGDDANDPAKLLAEAPADASTRPLEEIPPSGLADYLREHGPAYLIVGHGSKNQCAPHSSVSTPPSASIDIVPLTFRRLLTPLPHPGLQTRWLFMTPCANTSTSLTACTASVDTSCSMEVTRTSLKSPMWRRYCTMRLRTAFACWRCSVTSTPITCDRRQLRLPTILSLQLASTPRREMSPTKSSVSTASCSACTFVECSCPPLHPSAPRQMAYHVRAPITFPDGGYHPETRNSKTPEVVGATKIYFGRELVEPAGSGLVRGMFACGGGPISLDERNHCKAIGLPCIYVPSRSRHRQFGLLHSEESSRSVASLLVRSADAVEICLLRASVVVFLSPSKTLVARVGADLEESEGPPHRLALQQRYSRRFGACSPSLARIKRTLQQPLVSFAVDRSWNNSEPFARLRHLLEEAAAAEPERLAAGEASEKKAQNAEAEVAAVEAAADEKTVAEVAAVNAVDASAVAKGTAEKPVAEVAQKAEMAVAGSKWLSCGVELDAVKREIEQKRSVTVFLSSTFNGMELERKTFMEKYAPLLETKCDQSGVGLRIIDLRWGVTSEEANITNR
eukprot:4020170-Prymnesium_polylepis.1